MTDPIINEFVFNHRSTDTNEFIEVLAGPNADLSRFTILVIEGSGSNPGRIDWFYNLDSADANGYWTTGFLNNELENDTQTLLLVEDFTGNVGDDIDVSNNGTIDNTPWGRIVDSVAVRDGDTTDPVYTTAVLDQGFDDLNPFTVGGASRIPDGTDTDTAGDWVRNDFDREGLPGSTGTPEADEAVNTPGAENQAVSGTLVPIPLAIYEIQGATHTSPFDGQTIKTGGVVTAVAFNGFYLQDPDGDGDIATSDGIFVQSGDTVTIGQVVEVTGTVNEVRGSGRTTDLTVTQLNATDVADLGTAALPQAVILGDGGRKPPSEVVDDDAFASFDPTTDAIDFYESLEGMVVNAQDTVAVGAIRQFGRFSAETFTLLDDGADATPVDVRTERGGINLDSGPDNTGDQNPERVQIQFDGTLFGSTNYPEINVGDQLGDVTGVVGYSFGNYEVNIVGALNPDFDVVSGGNESETTEIAGDAEHLTVASYNVLNLTSTLASGDPDAAQRTLLAEQIVNNLGSPDIIALQEIQDNDGTDGGTSSTVTDASQTLQDLVDAIGVIEKRVANIAARHTP